MRFDEPLPEPPHRNFKGQGIALLVFIVVMTVICVLGQLDVFRR